MTPEQMREKSASKIKQVTDLMTLLHLSVEAKERMDKNGFIEKIVYYVDHEEYPKQETPASIVAADKMNLEKVQGATETHETPIAEEPVQAEKTE